MRVVLAWELGGNWGHVRRLRALGEALTAQGHSVHYVLQELGALRPLPRGAVLWPAPVWSGLLRHAALRGLGEPRRFGDVLANLGLQGSAMVEGLLLGWESLLSAIRPDVVVGDFAPSLMLAARGRMPRVAVGTGFTVPPTHLPGFPPFPGAETEPLVAEDALLTLVNRALERVGRPLLDHLPQMVQAEAALPAVFAELDPAGALRQDRLLTPSIPAEVLTATRPETPGAAVFAYLPAADLGADHLALVEALARRVPVTAVMPGLDATRGERLARAGVRLMQQALTWDRIAKGHSLVLCAGGMGTVSSALALGLPLAVLPHGFEQKLTARALDRAGLGALPGVSAEGLAGLILDETARGAALARAAEAAQGFRARMTDPVAETVSAITALAV
ncbi:hypothetical protein [Stagnihabitans tardus]|uniref:UDP:flavonoid glycosyltransferase YjiC, YdhE family n=1 Tax=Stagnihabitans tardus TaxID=2699202 RepID=A0AAE4Y8A4_9RHOB|nr:hypothetical protein [Stagnihabitans tardus]NBZ86483.1 hypothetical protein [Stagnihabitans tardus]